MIVYYFAVKTSGVVIRTSEGAVYIDGRIEGIRYEKGAPDLSEEYIIAGYGRKIVARPPAISAESVDKEIAAELAKREPQKNGLTEYIEGKSKGNGTPEIGRREKPVAGAIYIENICRKIRPWMDADRERTGNIMSQADLSHRSGLGQPEVSKHLREGARVTPKTVKKYAAAFGVSVEEFLRGPLAKKAENPILTEFDGDERVIVSSEIEEKICANCLNKNGQKRQKCDPDCALAKAKAHGMITEAVKRMVCERCPRRDRGQCGICRLGEAIAATGYFLAEMTPSAAVKKAEEDRAKEFERIAAEHDRKNGGRPSIGSAGNDEHVGIAV